MWGIEQWGKLNLGSAFSTGGMPYSSLSVATRGFVRWPPRKVYRKVRGVGIHEPIQSQRGNVWAIVDCANIGSKSGILNQKRAMKRPPKGLLQCSTTETIVGGLPPKLARRRAPLRASSISKKTAKRKQKSKQLYAAAQASDISPYNTQTWRPYLFDQPSLGALAWLESWRCASPS